VALLRETQGVDPQRIFVLGHSLGALLAPRIGAGDPKLAGLVIMAGPTRPLADVGLAQLDYVSTVSGPLGPAEQQQLDKLKAELRRTQDPDLATTAKPGELFFYAPASYWLDLRAYSPTGVAAQLAMPMLILQGGRDYQVTREDFEGWQKVLGSRANVKLQFHENLNHLFAEGQGMATPEEYSRPMHVAPGVVEEIAAWVSHPETR
jgi:hypothetical protein